MAAVTPPQNAPRVPVPAPPTGRMGLDNLLRGRIEKPPRTLLYGVEGIGKSTFAAEAPEPIFLGAEDGTHHLDIVRFPQPERWDDVREALRLLTHEKHDRKTFVIDTLDWMEPLVWADLCARAQKASIEDFGYGKGYVAALDEWRKFLAAVERLWNTTGMEIVFLAHAAVKQFRNPEGDDFDRYQLKIHGSAAGLVKEWCDAVLFANWQTFASKDERTKRVKGVSTGARMVYTTRTAAYDAKNRYDLPEELPLDWNEYRNAVRNPVGRDTLAAECLRKGGEVGGDVAAQTAAYVEAHRGDASALARLNNRLNALLAKASQEAK